jgi:hypothetical protein
MTRIATRLITDPRTGAKIRVPAHMMAPEPQRAPVPMSEWKRTKHRDA